MSVIILNGIILNLDEKEEWLAEKAAVALRTAKDNIHELEIIRRTIDARRSRPPHFCLRFEDYIAFPCEVASDIA